MESITSIRPFIRFANFTWLRAAIAGIIVIGSLALGGPAPAPQLPADSGASERYLTHVSTDKPIYRTGEKLYVRGVVLRADGHIPTASTGPAFIEIKGPKGDTVASGVATIVDSVMGFSWDIPASQAGGEYIVRISNPFTGDAPAERKFDIRAYRTPRLKSQIVFVRDGYGPGDTVAASLHVDRAEGGVPDGARVSIVARVDGEETWKGETNVDNLGNASASFKLPAAIARGEGTIAMIIQDGATLETATKTIPILLQTLDLGIYPEGGDLVAGLPNRVYVEGKTPARKPADMAGIIVDAGGREVANFRTEHEGRGRFSFTPVKGEAYSLRVTEPAGIKTIFPLPAVKASGVVISSISDVSPRRKDVVIRVAATAGGDYGVALEQRGKELSFTSVSLTANEPANVRFTLPKSLDGVIIATVYDDRKTPLAERLLFRQPDRGLKVNIVADQTDFIPGDKVTLRIATTDDTGKPIGAVVGLTVSDSSVQEMIDKREQAPRLPVMVLLENDVKNLSDAHIYLDETNPKAPLATDLLLGTQGWRRFATVDLTKFMTVNGDAARRALAINMLTDADRAKAATLMPQLYPVARGGAGGPVSTLSGTVADPTNALIPGVWVTATNTATGVVATVLTNDSGTYNFLTLQPGPYKLTAALQGFQTTTINNIVLGTPQALRFNVTLRLGNATGTTVDVSIDARQVLSQSSSSIGEVLSQERIQALPTVGNNVLDLLEVLPGFRVSAFGGQFDTITGLGLNSINTTINGLSTTNTRYDAQTYGYSVFTPTVINPDMVGEIRLILAPVEAERARQKQEQARAQAGQPAQSRPAARNAFVVVREYAHELRPDWTEGGRSDFAETLYWNAGIRTDASTGLATVSFNLSDSVTSFNVLADGFARDGTLGSGSSTIESVQPFFIEPKIPLQVTSGDVIQLPIGMVNGMSRELHGVDINPRAAAGLTFTLSADNNSTLRAKERARRLMQIDVGRDFSGVADLTLDASAGAYRDTVGRKLDVQPLGYPYELSGGGMLEANGSNSFVFTLPDETVRGSVTSSVIVYPTPLASMTEALQALLRQPNGCFEQTSSTSYPMVMAQQYFLTHAGVDPSIIEKTKNLLEASYKRLTGFESRSRGYEWFGADPAHEALTAYGLMQFSDMAQVRNMDKEMVQRTRAWLLARRDGNGGFNHDTRSHGSGFGSAPTDTANAYITWALVESGEKGLEKEIASVKASANATDDSYIIALAANILYASGDFSGARPLMDKLARNQDAAGNVKGATTSITRSGGDSLAIEATALSVLAWMREPSYIANVEKGAKWIVESNKSGRFGSTQSTILALRAIIAYDAAHARAKAPGRIVLIIDGKNVGLPLAFTAKSQGAIVMPEFASELGAGKHTVVLRMEDGSGMPFSVGVKYNSTLPGSAEQTRIGIGVSLKDRQIQEGGITEAIVSIINKSDEALPTPVAIVGIPGGMEVRHDQLKELVKSGKIDAYEVIGREVVLYWRYIKANDKFDIPLSLVAAVPGIYTGPASRAYLYYTDEYKNWAPGLKVSIVPR